MLSSTSFNLARPFSQNALSRYGMRSTGMVKTTITEIPMHFLASKKLARRVDNISMVSTNEYLKKTLMAVIWLDGERRYFGSSFHTTDQGTPISREQWRSVDGQYAKVQLDIFFFDVVKKHCETCPRTECHNRSLQDSLGLGKLEFKNWSMCVNSTLLSVIIVDDWLLYEWFLCAKILYVAVYFLWNLGRRACGKQVR